MIFTELEKRFDELTPDWIVSTGKLLNTFGEKSKFSFVVNFKGAYVRKASVSNVGGIRTWRKFKTKCGVPDFVVMSNDSMDVLSRASERCSKGLEYENPFSRGGKTGWYIELMGSYFHSGEYVQGLSREEHEQEVRDAYASAGAHVLILWEDEVWEQWDEICVPRLKEFLRKSNEDIKTPEWSHSCGIPSVDDDVCLSLSDAGYWRGLDLINRERVIKHLCSSYSAVDYPFPDSDMALRDFHCFMKWASKKSLRKPTRYGMQCCRYYARSMADARVKGKPSLREIWKDSKGMERAIRWQLENEKGSHNAKRFLNAMTHRVGFKVVANMRPATAVLWMKNYGKTQGVWLDLCAGWGSRMLAAHALGMEYIGIDANSVLVEELNHMASELGLSGVVHHGDASDESFVKGILEGRKADCSFTSPPFFDKESYSKDKEQSILQYPSSEDWHRNFLGKVIENALSFTLDDGVVLFNLGMNERLDMTGIDFCSGIYCDDVEVQVSVGGRTHSERLLRMVRKEQGCSLSACKVCGRLFSDLGIHLREAHGISSDEYRESNPKASVSRVSRNRPSGLVYRQREVFRCPDGSIVRKRDAWTKAWYPKEPPKDSILDASDVNLDRWRGKQEGIDFVTCRICGHRGKNITRHVRREHDIESYSGPLKSESCSAALSEAASKTWDTRGRKPERDKKDNKTHKVNGLTEDALRGLYEGEGLSDAKIGEKYGMTGEGVAYRRKKWGIPTRKKKP